MSGYLEVSSLKIALKKKINFIEEKVINSFLKSVFPFHAVGVLPTSCSWFPSVPSKFTLIFTELLKGSHFVIKISHALHTCRQPQQKQHDSVSYAIFVCSFQISLKFYMLCEIQLFLNCFQKNVFLGYKPSNALLLLQYYRKLCIQSEREFTVRKSACYWSSQRAPKTHLSCISETCRSKCSLY